ncbi:class I SAM-dependent methyltransferase [Echinicola sediminis]
MDTKDSIYDPKFVKQLFDNMSKTYGLTNYLSSFGFTERWRRQCVKALPDNKIMKVGYDLMSGMGESWELILQKVGKVQLFAVDISDAMNQKADVNKKRLKAENVTIVNANVLDNGFPAASADFIISTFGVKTFSREQNKILAKEIYRLLKPKGTFSLVEISKPTGWILGSIYMFYLKFVIPIIGRLFNGNSADYRMLGRYCEQFQNCRELMGYLQEEGLEVSYQRYFFGCATGVTGRKKD